jgi:hypothetical protein
MGVCRCTALPSVFGDDAHHMIRRGGGDLSLDLKRHADARADEARWLVKMFLVPVTSVNENIMKGQR